MACYQTLTPAALVVVLSRVAALCRRTGLTTVDARSAALREAGISARSLVNALRAEINRQESRASDRIGLALKAHGLQSSDRFYRIVPQDARDGRLRSRVLGRISGAALRALDPATPLKQRLAEVRRKAVAGLYRRTYRYGAAGGSSMTVGLTNDPAQVMAKVTMSSNRDTYKGNYRTYSAAEDHHLVRVPVDWRLRVQRQGLDSLGGMMTLDAQRLDVDAGEGIEVWAATWVEQSRGYTVTTRQGVIAVLREGGRITHEYHGADVRRALLGLRHKVAGCLTTAKTPDLDRLAARRGDEWVPVAVARAIGACDYGIRSWCQRVGLSGAYAAGGCTLAELVAGYRESPVIEARATILRAMRRRGQVAA